MELVNIFLTLVSLLVALLSFIYFYLINIGRIGIEKLEPSNYQINYDKDGYHLDRFRVFFKITNKEIYNIQIKNLGNISCYETNLIKKDETVINEIFYIDKILSKKKPINFFIEYKDFLNITYYQNVSFVPVKTLNGKCVENRDCIISKRKFKFIKEFKTLIYNSKNISSL